MITGAMQTMLENMLREAVQNLPPDLQEKIRTGLGFLASVDARMTAMERDIAFLRSKFEPFETMRKLEHGRSDDTAGNRDDNPAITIGDVAG